MLQTLVPCIFHRLPQLPAVELTSGAWHHIRSACAFDAAFVAVAISARIVHIPLHIPDDRSPLMRSRNACVQTPDSKKEEFRKYLEKSGVIDALTKGE